MTAEIGSSNASPISAAITAAVSVQPSAVAGTALGTTTVATQASTGLVASVESDLSKALVVPVEVILANIKAKIAYVESLGASINKDIENAPAEVRAEFERVESKLTTFVKNHLSLSFLVDTVGAGVLGAVIAHVLK